MAGSGSFDKLGGISSGPADLFGLMAFNLRRTESSQTITSVTEGTEQSMRSLCCAGKSVIGSFVSQASFARRPVVASRNIDCFLRQGFPEWNTDVTTC